MLYSLSLKKKILAGGLIPLIVVALINLVGLGNFNGVIQSHEWVDRTHQVIEKGLEIENDAMDMERGMLGFLLTGKEAFLEPYEYRKSVYHQRIEALKSEIADKEALEALEEAETDIEEWEKKIAKPYIQIRRETAASEVGAKKIEDLVAKGEGKAYMDEFHKHMQKFTDREEALLKKRLEEAASVTRTTNLVIVFGTLVALILAVVISFAMIRIITDPITAIKEAALKISAGDTDVTVDVKNRDELAELAAAFREMAKNLNDTSAVAHQIGQGDLSVSISKRSEKDVLGNALENMVANLSTIIAELKESVMVLSSAAGEILSTTAQVASSANQTSSAVAETSASVEEIKQTAKISSAKAVHTAESTNKTMEIAGKGSDALNENMDGLVRIKEKMDLIAANIIQLSEQSQMIGEIVATVEDIANQSNLLAVNASIEAVKAGEHGKGFSVVAQELKNLADQSKQGTRQVQKILSDIQQATGTLVMVAEQGGKAVETGVDQANNAKESMNQLNMSIQDAAKAGKQIAASYEQELMGMDQISDAMNSIKEATSQNVSSIRQVEESAKNLNALGQKLKLLMEQYKIAENKS